MSYRKHMTDFDSVCWPRNL